MRNDDVYGNHINLIFILLTGRISFFNLLRICFLAGQVISFSLLLDLCTVELFWRSLLLDFVI